VPIGAVVLTTVVACLGLLLGLNSAAVGSLITFGTAAIYLTFFMIALAALIARVSGRWVGRRAATLNALAVAWLAFETVNIAWPRRSLAPPDAPDYQVWAAPLFIGAVCLFGLIYLVVARPDRRVALGNADPANLGGAGAAGHEVGEQA
jgi:amino acid transporter